MVEHDAGDNAFMNPDSKGDRGESTFAGALSFLRTRYSRELEGVDAVVMGVPFDTATTNRPGARFGPRGVRAASTMMAFERPYGLSFDPRREMTIIDYGDVAFDHGRPGQIPGIITGWTTRAGSIMARCSITLPKTAWSIQRPRSRSASAPTTMTSWASTSWMRPGFMNTVFRR